MRFSSNYNKFLDEVIGNSGLQSEAQQAVKEKILAEREKHEEKLERQFNLKTKKWLSILIALLFSTSYIVLVVVLAVVFSVEKSWIEEGIMQVSDRTINSEVTTVLIGGTITQAAVSFIALAKYFFSSAEKSAPKKDVKI